VYHNIKKSGIYAIVAHPILFPYNDGARWIFTHLDTEKTIIVNEFKVPMDSLSSGDINTRYHLLEYELSLNKTFLHKSKEDELVEDWWKEEINYLKKSKILILVQYLKRPYRLLATMICKFYGEETNTHY
jgi:hypothetical protein